MWRRKCGDAVVWKCHPEVTVARLTELPVFSVAEYQEPGPVRDQKPRSQGGPRRYQAHPFEPWMSSAVGSQPLDMGMCSHSGNVVAIQDSTDMQCGDVLVCIANDEKGKNRGKRQHRRSLKKYRRSQGGIQATEYMHMLNNKASIVQ